jgi:hypothetical protein
MKKYTAKEISEMTGVSGTRLSVFVAGRDVKRNGKVEWHEPALLNASDYERVIENGRAKIYYFESAVEKIRAKRGG